MSQNNVDINIKTAVENQKDVTELQKEIIKLGESSQEVDQQVDSLTSTLDNLIGATKLKEALEKSSQELETTTANLEKAREAFKTATEEAESFAKSADSKALKDMNKALSDQEKEIKKLELAQSKAQKKYSDTNKALETSSGSIKRLVVDTDHYAETVKKVEVAQTKLNAELTKLKEVGDAYSKLGVQDLEKEIDDLGNAYKALKDSGKLSLNELKQAHDAMTEEIEKHKKALNGTTQAYKDLKTGAIHFLPVAAAFAKVTKSAIEYEDAMVGLRKVANGTDEELNQLENDVLKLSRAIPMSAAEIAKMAEAGARVGKSVNELTGFVELSAKAASAFGVSAEDAGKYISKLGTVFGGTAEETEKLVEAINMFDDSIDANAADITTVINNIGAIGQAAGLSGQQLSALSATVLAAGNTASVTSTSLKNFLNGLANVKNGTSDAKKSLESLGFTVEGFSQQLRDNGEQAIVDFLTRLGQLEKQAQIDVAGKMFGSAAQAQVMQMALTVDIVAEQFKKVGNYASYAGKVTEQFNKTNQSTSAQYQLLKNQLNEISIELGTKLLPVLNDVIGATSSVVDGIKSFSDAYPVISSLIIQMTLLVSASKLLGPILTIAAAKGASGLATLKVGVQDLSIAMGGLASRSKYTFRSLNTGLDGVSKSSIAAANASKLLRGALSLLGVQLWGLNTAIEAYQAFSEQMAAKQAVKEAEAKALQMIADRADKLADAQLRAALATGRLTEEQEKAGLSAKDLADEENKLREIANKLGVDYELVTTGISTANKDLINGFRELGENAATSSKLISQGFSKVLNEIQTPQEFEELIIAFNGITSSGKIAEEELSRYSAKLEELRIAVATGTITEADFIEKKKELVAVIAEQKNGFAEVNHEISKQVQLINTQIALDKKLVDSVIRKLEAEKEMAKAMNDTVKVQEIERQIQATRIAGMKDEAKTVAKLVEEYKKELLVLQAREANGQALTEAEQQRVRALKAEIEARNNEIEAINKSADAKELDIAMSYKNASALDGLAKSANNAASAQQSVASAVSKAGDASEKTVQKGGEFTSWLKGMADESMKSEKAIADLEKSVREVDKALAQDAMHGNLWTSTKMRKAQQSALIDNIVAQIKKSEAIEEEMQKGASMGVGAIEAMQESVRNLSYVNEEVTKNMTDNLEKLRNEAKNTYAEIDRESADMINNLTLARNQDETHRLRMQQINERASLESKILQAQEDGDNEREIKLRNQLMILQQLHNQQQRSARNERQAQERSKNQKIDITLNGTNLKNLDPDNPEDMRKISMEVVNLIAKDRQKSTQFVIKDNKRRA